VARRSAR